MTVSDEIARKIQRCLLWFFVSCLFSFVILHVPDLDVINPSGSFQVPILGFPIERRSFLLFGPIIIISLNTYLLVISNNLCFSEIEIDKNEYIFLSENAVARWVTAGIFYFLGPVVLFLFYWKNLPKSESLMLGGASVSVLIAYTICFLRRYASNHVPESYHLKIWLLSLSIGAVFVALHYSGALISIRGMNLARSDLSSVQLNDANLFNANLSHANLHLAELQEADLSGADIGGACLSHAILIGADMNDAYLRGSNLFRANMRGADLRHTELYKAQLIKANLSETQMQDACLYKTNLTGASLEGANLSRANLYRSVITNESIDHNTNFTGAYLVGVEELTCLGLTRAIGWESAIRSERLLCKAESPTPETDDRYWQCETGQREETVSTRQDEQRDEKFVTEDHLASDYLSSVCPEGHRTPNRSG